MNHTPPSSIFRCAVPGRGGLNPILNDEITPGALMLKGGLAPRAPS